MNVICKEFKPEESFHNRFTYFYLSEREDYSMTTEKITRIIRKDFGALPNPLVYAGISSLTWEKGVPVECLENGDSTELPEIKDANDFMFRFKTRIKNGFTIQRKGDKIKFIFSPHALTEYRFQKEQLLIGLRNRQGEILATPYGIINENTGYYHQETMMNLLMHRVDSAEVDHKQQGCFLDKNKTSMKNGVFCSPERFLIVDYVYVKDVKFSKHMGPHFFSYSQEGFHAALDLVKKTWDDNCSAGIYLYEIDDTGFGHQEMILCPAYNKMKFNIYQLRSDDWYMHQHDQWCKTYQNPEFLFEDHLLQNRTENEQLLEDMQFLREYLQDTIDHHLTEIQDYVKLYGHSGTSSYEIRILGTHHPRPEFSALTFLSETLTDCPIGGNGEFILDWHGISEHQINIAFLWLRHFLNQETPGLFLQCCRK